MNDQNTMFTNEQMTGSGQMNMVDLINANEDRKKYLRSLPHTFYNDPSHGWLKVEFNDLKVLGILGAITGFSYRRGSEVYLEEDLDAQTYINALFTDYTGRSVEDHSAFKMWRDMITDHHSNSDSFVRNLNQFYRG